MEISTLTFFLCSEEILNLDYIIFFYPEQGNKTTNPEGVTDCEIMRKRERY